MDQLHFLLFIRSTKLDLRLDLVDLTLIRSIDSISILIFFVKKQNMKNELNHFKNILDKE